MAGIDGAFHLNIFHRDVSVRNIMIRDPTNPAYSKYARPRTVGILNDWDHAIIVTFDRIVHDYRTVSNTTSDLQAHLS